MKFQLSAFIVALVVFSIYTTGVVINHGYTGFLTLAWKEPWAAQVLIDLVIALTLFLTWMFRDAQAKKISPWPYIVLTLTLGSIGALAYMVHRTVKLSHGNS